jgi:thioredoxin-like negative regulator of GroEL
VAVAELRASDWDTQAGGSPIPFLVGFWAEWCVPSRHLAGALEAAAERHAGRLRVGLVDAEREPALAERYGLQGLPTVILFRSGSEVLRRIGLLTAAELSRLVDLHQ